MFRCSKCGAERPKGNPLKRESVMRRCISLVVVVLILASGLQGLSADQGVVPMTPEELMFMEIPMVVTVSRREHTVAETPGIVTVMTAREMEELGCNTVQDALRFIPGFQISNTPRRNFQYTRGQVLSALVMIDGMPIVNPMDREAFVDYDIAMDNIDRIEVVRGPGGVLWGATAFVGIINIVTKRATSEKGAFTLSSKYGSNSTRKIGMNFNKKGEEVSTYVNYSELHAKSYLFNGDELRSPWTGYWFDGYQNSERKASTFKELFLKFGYKDFMLTTRVADQVAYYQADSAGRAFGPGFDMAENDPVKELYSLEYKKSFENFSLRSRIWRMVKEYYLEGFSSIGTAAQRTAYYTGNTYYIYGLTQDCQNGIEAEATLDKLIPKNILLVGAVYMDQKGEDVYHRDAIRDWRDNGTSDAVDPDAFYKGWPDMNGDGGSNSTNWQWKWEGSPIVAVGPGENVRSAYVSDTWKVNDDLSLGGGFRYDHNSAYDEVTHFSANAVYQLKPNHYIKYMYAEGFRPASWEQKNSLAIGGGNLKPEQSKSHDIQYNGELGYRLTFFINHAITDLTDAIKQDSNSIYNNTGESTINASEVGCKYALPSSKGYAFLNYTHLNVYDRTAKADVVSIAEHVANLGVYRKLPYGFGTSLTAHYESGPTANLLPDGVRTNLTAGKVKRTLDAYTVFNWGLHYAFENWKASAFVYNVLDTRYESLGSTVALPNPLRNFMVNLSYMF
jgi:outer membrane cobalamin receptor